RTPVARCLTFSTGQRDSEREVWSDARSLQCNRCVDCRPIAVKNFLSYTLRHLKVSYIDIYRPARIDPAVPIEGTVGAVAEMTKAGYVRYLGLSEVGVNSLRRANATHPRD